MFLQRLPRELRILLAHEDLADLKLLAARADALHTHHSERGGGVVYAVASSEVYPVDSAEVYAVASGSGVGAGRQAQGLGGRGSAPNRGRSPSVEDAAVEFEADRERALRRSKPGRLLASVTRITCLGSLRTPVPSPVPAAGRETGRPGRTEHRQPRPPPTSY